MMDWYTGSPTVRIVVEFFKSIPVYGPLVAAIDAGTVAAFERDRKGRFSILLDEIEQLGIDPDAPLPEGDREEIIRAIFVTTAAIDQARNWKKVESISRLFAAGLQVPPRISFATEFDDYLEILIELSVRESLMLNLLAEFERPYFTGDIDTRREHLDEYWQVFTAALSTELGIPSAETAGLLSRIGRTGMFEPVTRPVAGFNRSQGLLSGAYYRLRQTLQDNPAHFRQRPFGEPTI